MNNIDSQINDRMNTYAGNPQALQQRYAQTQELVDLLALQKMKNDRAAATNAVQGAMQTDTNTYKGQLEQEAMQGARNDVLRSMAPGIQQQGQRMAQMQNRAAMGIPTQSAPNMARMANGGIVGYADGGEVEVNVENAAGTGSLLDKIKRYPQYQEEEGFMGRMPDFFKYVPDQFQNANFYLNEFMIPKLKALAETDPTIRARFNEAFRAARNKGATDFMFMGDAYNTKYVEEMSGGGIVGYQQGGNVIGYNSRGSVDLLGAALEAEGITDPATINLIRSIYAQESSSGQNTGVSPAGARGGMQVMPATFREMMGADADINDPMTNLRAGSRYAQQMLKQAGGDPRLAAAAYYGGPDEIAKLRAGNDTTAPQDGFPSVAEYADQVVNRAGSAERAVGDNPTGRPGDYTGNLEAAGIDPDFFASTYREGAGKGARPEVTKDQTEGAIDEAYFKRTGRRRRRPIFKPAIDAVSSFLDTMTTPPEYVINEAGYRVVNPTVRRSGEEVGETVGDYNARRVEIKEEIPGLTVSEQAVLAGQELSTEEKRSREGAPLGDRVPSKDASRAVGGDPLNVQGMVDRLVAPPFRTQGIIRDAEPTNRQKFAKALGLPLKDFEKKAPPPEKKRMFDDVDIGRLQAFLAGGAGQTSTPNALVGGLRGLMGEDQRREAIASKEGIEAAKIASQRYGIEQDFDAAMAKIGAENRRAVFKAQRDALEAYEGDKRELAADALFDITNGRDEQFNQNSMRLRETYGNDPEGLTRELIALTNKTLDDRMRSVAGATGGSNSGVFEVELPSGG